MSKFVFITLIVALSAQTSRSQVPALLTIQGPLTDQAGNLVESDNYDLEVTIWNDSISRQAVHLLWSEIHAQQPISTGMFNLVMGSITPLTIPFDEPYWFELRVSSKQESWVIQPRFQLTAMAYSLNTRSLQNDAITSQHIINQSILSKDLADNTLTADKIKQGQLIRSLNNLTDNILLKAGEHIDIKAQDSTITISANIPESPHTVASINGIQHEVQLIAGEHIDIKAQDNTITISQTESEPAVINSLSAAGNNSEVALLVNAEGQVGIGTTSFNNILTVQQHAATTPIADAWAIYSSRRWKEHIHTIDGAVDKVMQLRGVRYNWKETGTADIGLIAEEVGQVIPEIVTYEENKEDASSVDYARLVAVLIEAVKEQQEHITAQQNVITSLHKKTTALERNYQYLNAKLNTLSLDTDLK